MQDEKVEEECVEKELIRKLESEKIKWYTHPEVKFQIKEWTKIPRDVSIFQKDKDPRRYCIILGSNNVDFIIKRMRICKINASIYASLIHYDFIEPNREQNQVWRSERRTHITGVDFGIDFDDNKHEDGSPRTWNNIINQISEFKNLLDSNNVRYSIWMSGKKGFQFIISCKDFPDSFKKLSTENLVNLQREISLRLRKKYPNLDTSVYSDDRIFKCPYTITGDGVVIFPLTDDDLRLLISGELLLTPKFILNHYNIRDRGYAFNGNSESTKIFLENLRRSD